MKKSKYPCFQVIEFFIMEIPKSKLKSPKAGKHFQ